MNDLSPMDAYVLRQRRNSVLWMLLALGGAAMSLFDPFKHGWPAALVESVSSAVLLFGASRSGACSALADAAKRLGQELE